jgi:hypothetical protein
MTLSLFTYCEVIGKRRARIGSPQLQTGQWSAFEISTLLGILRIVEIVWT